MQEGQEKELSNDEVHALNAAEEDALLADEDLQDEAGTPGPDADTEDAPQPEVVNETKTAPKLESDSTGDKPAADDKPRGGDPRAALRAARRSEQRARQEADALRAEVEALRKQKTDTKTPETTADLEEMTDEEIAEAEIDYPIAAKAARLAKAAQAELAQLKAERAAALAATPKTEAEPEFVPDTLPADLQAVVDDNADLLDWQYDRDQTRFQMAKATDALLVNHPKWKNAGIADRLAEVVRRVNAETLASGTEPTAPKKDETTPKVNVKDVLDKAPRVKPNTLSDIGGGGDTPKPASNLGRFGQMSDADIEADLLMG